MKNTVKEQILSGERSLFGARELFIENTVFGEGESPLKESRNIELHGSMFKWKYPLWYAEDILAEDCVWFEMARAGVWYTNRVTVRNSAVEAPKSFRRCHGVTLENVSFSNASETLWHCSDVKLCSVTAKGDYFAMNSRGMEIDGLTLYGDYSFDGVRDTVIRNSRLLTKDAFWNSENVTVYDSFISGEYLGWNAKGLTLVNCTVESLQGMCYIDGLVMRNCKLLNTTLAFEYSTVDAEIDSGIESVMNPASGRITAAHIGRLILERDRIDPSKTVIVCKNEKEQSDAPGNAR